MSNYIETFINQHREYFKRNKKFIENNDWNNTEDYKSRLEELTTEISNLKGKDKEKRKEKLLGEIRALGSAHHTNKANSFKQEADVTSSVLNRLKSFVQEIDKKGDRKNSKAKYFLKTTAEIINLHVKKCDDYLNYSLDELGKADTEEEIEFQGNEIKFQDNIFNSKINMQDTLEQLRLDDEGENTEAISFLNGTKAPLSMHWVLSEIYPEINSALEKLGVDPEAEPDNNLHLYNENPPKYNPKKHYWEQEKEVLDYYFKEFKKLKQGIVIDGYYMSGWMYYHMNIFKTPIPHKVLNKKSGEYESKDIVINPPLRDSDVILFENHEVQKKENYLFMFIAATRRAAKTTLETSKLGHASLIGKKELLCAGGSAKDLNQIAKNFKIDLLHRDEAFTVYNVTNDWKDKVELGLKTKANKTIPLATLNIVNTDKGNNVEILAGYTPDEFLYDEAMKGDFLEALQGLKPALKGADGLTRCFGLLSGCVCKGTKVFTKEGKVVNIEDLKKENGIIGFDSNKAIAQSISYMKEPAKKNCLRITTVGGNQIECSDDHPFLSYTDKPNSRTLTGVRARDLKIGGKLLMPEKIGIYGKEKIKDSRLLGLMIGDGHNKNKWSVEIAVSENEIYNFLKENYDISTRDEYELENGETYRRCRIKKLSNSLDSFDILGRTKKNKRLPSNIEIFDKESLSELLGGYFDADGHVKTFKKGLISIVLTSYVEELLKQVQIQLLKFGVHSSIVKEYRKKGYKSGNIYRLHIDRKHSIFNFQKNIKLLVKKKQNRIDNYVETQKNRRGLTVKKNINFKLSENNKFSFYKEKRINNVVEYRIKKIELLGSKDVYNLTAEGTHTYIANGFITSNTGGDDELSADGFRLIHNPEGYSTMPMNWDLLERGVPEEYRTWEEDKNMNFTTFIPGQMCVDMPKIESSLGEYIGRPESEELCKIKLKVTNWEEATKRIETSREKLEGDKLAYNKEVVYIPLKPSEIFLSGKINPFPVTEAKAHREYLLTSGKWDRRRDIYRDSQQKIRVELSKKELAKFPHKGGIIDAPFLIFEDPPNEKPKYGTYSAGFDDYATDDSETSSLASFYIFKNKVLGDPFSEKIVASITYRPERHHEVYERWLLLMELYGLDGTCFGENFNYEIKNFLDRRHLADKYLAPSLDFTQSFNLPNNLKRKTGWSPTTCKRHLFQLFVDYCNETFEFELEDGRIEVMKGVQRIDDIGLLDEIIAYSENVNVDRITSAMGAYGYIYFLQSSYRWCVKEFKKTEERKEKPRPKRKNKFYSGRKMNLYRGLK